MLRPASRAGRYRPLAHTLAALAALGTLAALGACADGPPATAPNVRGAPAFAMGDVYTVTNTNDNGLGSLRSSLGYTAGGHCLVRPDGYVAYRCAA